MKNLPTYDAFISENMHELRSASRSINAAAAGLARLKLLQDAIVALQNKQTGDRGSKMVDTALHSISDAMKKGSVDEMVRCVNDAYRALGAAWQATSGDAGVRAELESASDLLQRFVLDARDGKLV